MKNFQSEIVVGLKSYNNKMGSDETEVFEIATKRFLNDRMPKVGDMTVNVESVHVDNQFVEEGVTNGVISVSESKNKGRVLRRLNESGLRTQMTIRGYTLYTTLPEEFSFDELVSSTLESDFDLFMLEMEETLDPSTISRAETINEETRKYGVKFWAIVLASGIALVAVVIIFAWEREKNIAQRELDLFEAVHADSLARKSSDSPPINNILFDSYSTQESIQQRKKRIFKPFGRKNRRHDAPQNWVGCCVYYAQP